MADTTKRAENRIRAEAVLSTIVACQTWTGAGFNGGHHSEEELSDVAEVLNVPMALIWLGVGQPKAEQIDALVAWWPRKEGA